MEKNKSVPAIRFKGFTEEWEEKEFSNTFLFLNNNTLSRAELNYENGSVKNVHYGDVLIKFSECLDVSKEELPYITNEKIVDKYARLHDGDIIIADAAEDETVGKCTELLNVNEQVVAGLHTIACRPLFSFANRYLGYLLNASVFHNQLLPLMQGTKIVGISKSAIKDTLIYYPEFTEQTQIGNYFQNIDKLIEAKQSRIDKLKNIKKACLEKMFPKNGATTPEIRFKGFIGEWETKCLNGNEFEITAGGDIDKNKLNKEGNYPVYANALVNDGIVGYYLDEYRISAPAVTVTGRGDVGHAQARKISFTPVVRLLAIKSPHDVDYMENAINKLEVFVESTGVPQLTVPQIGKHEIWFPIDDAEEKRIGLFFSNFDNLISQDEQQLAKLKNIKKACLEKMFVNKEDAL